MGNEMEKPFAWKSIERMANLQETLGYIIFVCSAILAVGLFILGGEPFLRLSSLLVLGVGFITGVHHLSVALRMRSMQDINRRMNSLEANDGTSTSHENKAD